MSCNEFYQGFAVALGALARNGYPSMAVDIMRTNGVSLKQLERARCDDFDLSPLREEITPSRGANDHCKLNRFTDNACT